MRKLRGWSIETRKRAAKEHARKKASKIQRQHLLAIKTPAQLRAIVLASRRKQP